MCFATFGPGALNLFTGLVLRDDAYGFIAWHQDEQDRPRDGVDLKNPDLAALATASGASYSGGHRNK